MSLSIQALATWLLEDRTPGDKKARTELLKFIRENGVDFHATLVEHVHHFTEELEGKEADDVGK